MKNQFIIFLDHEECLALNVLHQWQLYPICGAQLVPEHIERRSLFNIKKSGLEQVSFICLYNVA